PKLENSRSSTAAAAPPCGNVATIPGPLDKASRPGVLIGPSNDARGGLLPRSPWTNGCMTRFPAAQRCTIDSQTQGPDTIDHRSGGEIMNRRVLVAGIAFVALLTMLASLPGGLTAQGKVVKIGLSLPLAGADADGADAILKGAQMAIAEINAKGGAAGYKLEAVVSDSATPAAGQYDPAQAATNYKKFIADTLVLVAVGPIMSGEGKAISPILSEADMATITPSSTNPDITDPKFQAQYRPKGKAVYFRTVTTDAYQGPNMANYLVHAQKIKSVFVLDDGGAFGVGIADSFQKRVGELGVKILGRDRLDPKEADYKTILTKIKGVNPDALYYGGG